MLKGWWTMTNSMQRLGKLLLALLLALGLTGIASASGLSKTPPARGTAAYETWLTAQVRHRLLMLPFYSVFDNLQYQVNGDTVTLLGEVERASLKDDAAETVKKIEGVQSVQNNIEILPLSPNDSRIRRAEFRAIYSRAPLQRYALGAVPPIHIIVKNGNVTLEGAVANEADKNIAVIAAKGVSDVFSVTDHLTINE
jgi:hyperosmotically inducible periplasmic protein